jgi:hypothetical protein
MEKEISQNRPDLIFSYWILVWYLLYITKIVPYNPVYLFYVGICLACIQIAIMFAYHKSFAYISSFIIATLLLKGIPIYTIYKRKTTKTDICVMIGLVVFYVCWLKMNDKNLKRFLMEYLTPDENGRKSFPINNFFYQIMSSKI